jgi:hypothetical protein
MVYARVCSWLCAAEFSIGEATKQRERLLSQIEVLEKKSERITMGKQVYGFHQP